MAGGAPLRIVEGGAADRRSLYESTLRGFLVTNYEHVVRDLDAVTAWAPDLVVLDEAQRIKNWAARTALTIKRLKGEFLRLMALLLTQRVIANGMAQLNFPSIWPVIRDRAPEPKLIESLAAPKLVEFRELVSNLVLTQKRKVVVFSQFRRMLELASWSVSDLLSAGGVRRLFFTGQEGARRRTQNLVDFHDDPKAAILFLTDAGGVGLNLQKAANACINLELPWNPAVLEQRIGRIHRLGQRRPIDVYNLVSRACIEERIAGLVAGKRALFKGLFDGTTDQLQFDRSGALGAVLERLVAEPAPPPAAVRSSVEAETEDQPSVDAPAHEPETGDEIEPTVVFSDADGVEGAPAIAHPAVSGAQDAPSFPAISYVGQEDIGRMLGALTVERGPDGGVRIEAPPHAARAFMSLFEGMARLMGAAAERAPVCPPTESVPRPVA